MKEGNGEATVVCVCVCVFQRVGSEVRSDSRPSTLCVRVKSVWPEENE